MLLLGGLYPKNTWSQAQDQASEDTLGSLSSPQTTKSCCRLAVVNMEQILNQSPQYKSEVQRLAEAFSVREKQLAEEQEDIKEARDAFQRVRSALSEPERILRESELRFKQRNHSRRFADFREEVRFSKDKALVSLQQQVQQAVEAVREQQGIDIVFRENNYVSASERVNLTSQVIQYLEQQFSLSDITNEQ